MKDITNFISEGLKINAKSKVNTNIDIDDLKLDFLDKYRKKHISKEDLVKYCLEALKNCDLTASDIIDELSQYKNPDDLDRAWENEDLDNYCHFENILGDLLADDDNYAGYEGDICDMIWNNAYDLMIALEKMTLNK